jgi:hypothetical protein
MASQDLMKPTDQLALLEPLFPTSIMIHKHLDLQCLAFIFIKNSQTWC